MARLDMIANGVAAADEMNRRYDVREKGKWNMERLRRLRIQQR
jgi:hypothetical protein